MPGSFCGFAFVFAWFLLLSDALLLLGCLSGIAFLLCSLRPPRERVKSVSGSLPL